jgi:protein TonB
MTAHQDCFVRLGLEDGADERQVRRAYARELKLIDQERDLEGFQYLRACYEAALELVRTGEGQSATGAGRDAANPVPPPGAEVLPVQDVALSRLAAADPRENAAAVFADFRTGIAALAALPERHAHHESRRAGPWRAALRKALADPRLVHIEAPAIFERHVGDLLAAGWQPGHHLLLSAAVDVFGWNEEHGAFEHLGDTGRVLDAVLTQRAVFQHQDVLARTKQNEVFLLLRQPRLPGTWKRRRYIGHLLTLTEHFPEMLHVLAPQTAVTAWRAQCPDATPASFVLADHGPRKSAWSSGIPFPGALVIVFFVIMTALTSHSGRDTSHDDAAADAPRTGGAQRADQGSSSAPGDTEPLTAEEIDAIRKHIDYHPGDGFPLSPQLVRYRVTLDAEGNIVDIAQLETSTDPAFGAAVEQAIRAVAPFVHRRSRQFHVWFRVERTPPDAPQPATPAPSATRSPR